MKRFTDPVIKRLKPRDKKFTVTEGEGLYLQVSPKGAKAWKHYGKTRKWFKIGDYPAFGIKDARTKNEELKKQTDRGEDPRDMEGFNHDPTLRELYEEWIGKSADRKGKPWSEAHKRNVRYMFKKDILKSIGNRKVREIRKRDIIMTVEKVEARGSENQALQVYRRLSRLLNFAAERDIIEVSPIASLPPIGKQSIKSRYLTPKEIKTLLQHLPDADMAKNTAHALEIILRTGQRPSEVAGAHKDEIHEHWWTIPPERTKNSMEHRVYLSDQVLSLFGEANEHGYYFPSYKNNNKPISHTVISKALRRSLTGAEKKKSRDKITPEDITIPIKEAFTPHDLRRTCATYLAELGYIDEIIGAVLNHKKQSVTGIYNQYRYDQEKQKALEAWDRKLAVIIKGKKSDNVVPMIKQV